jgi:ribosomal protein S18 acetylase RimI-like enzyme
MYQTTASPITNADRDRTFSNPFDVAVTPLVARDEAEVLEFLAQRPIHTVAMMSMITDNGIVSPLNRGTFYGCRDCNGQLEGVALIGHATLLETVSDRALRALAEVARDCSFTHMIMGEKERVIDFWEYYIDAGVQRRLVCREWLYELRWPIVVSEPIGLKLATKAELEDVMPIQAELAYEESGVNPMIVDPEGFRRRCLRRIEMGRTWVLIENGELIFKADVISQTSEVIYIEGVWVKEDRRNDGTGIRCMNQLSQALLQQSKSICLLVNETNKQAQQFYSKCGFLFRSTYETIFLPRKESALQLID